MKKRTNFRWKENQELQTFYERENFLLIYKKINEQYLRNLNELMICLNDNLGRIKDIWEINLNWKTEKTKIRNSLDIFYIYANIISSYYKNLMFKKIQ